MTGHMRKLPTKPKRSNAVTVTPLTQKPKRRFTEHKRATGNGDVNSKLLKTI